MSKYVYSTLATDMHYTNYKKSPDLPSVEHVIRIRGKAGVADKKEHTPIGVVTRISDEQADHLETNEVFKIHKRNNHVLISDREVSADNVAADMNREDPSRPLVDGDFANDATGAPTFGDPIEDEPAVPAPRNNRGGRR